MKRLVYIAVSSLIFLPHWALADDAGAYLGAGLASASLSSSCADGYFSSCNTPSSSPKDSGHLRLIGGYNFDRHFGIEAGLSELGTYRVHDNAGVTVGDFKASALTLALKGGNTFANGFSVFGKLGLASVRTQYHTQPTWTLAGSSDQRSTGLVAGVGGQYNINHAVGFRVSFEMIDFADAEFQNYASGVALTAVFKL